MNSTLQTALGQTEIPNEPDWALAGIPDSINATGLLADDLEEYGALTEIQTLILACVATVIPLFLGLLLVLGVRMVWKKYKNHNTNSGYDNDGLRREDSCDAVKSSSFMQSAEELKTSESQYSVLMPDEAAACCYAAAEPLPPLTYNSPPNNRFGDTNKTNLNGSIITLTMKNNHLIVETEERVPGNVYLAESTADGGADKSADYEYDDDEFDMEAEMMRREFREASLLANGGGGGGGVGCGPVAAVLEPSVQTQVDLTADRRPTAAASACAFGSGQQPLQLQQPAAAAAAAAVADHSSGGSSSADSRVAEMAYAYGNQSEYTAEDGKHKVVVGGGVQTAAAGHHHNHYHHHHHHQQQLHHHNNNNNSINNNNNNNNSINNNNNNNNDDEYLVEQRLLGNGADGGGTSTDSPSPPPPPTPSNDNCSPDRVATAAAAQ